MAQQFPKVACDMTTLSDLRDSKFGQGVQSRPLRTTPATNRRVARFDRGQSPPEMALEEVLSSALLASDVELGQILHEVDEISKCLKSEAPDQQTLRVVQHPAVWGAVKQTLLDRELRYLALTDDLTCLYNRRAFFAVATQLLKLAHRKKQTLLLFFCDVDNLKTVNDSFGHREGDLLLVRTADALEQSFREADLIARMGGDEFVIMSLDASSGVEGVLLRRLERNLRKAGAKETRYKLSLSVGVARFDPEHAISLGDLMSQADEAMYEQKRKKHAALSAGQARAGAAQDNDKNCLVEIPQRSELPQGSLLQRR